MTDSMQMFSKFGKQFQEKIFQAMLGDSVWSSQMVEVMNPSFFDVEYLRNNLLTI